VEREHSGVSILGWGEGIYLAVEAAVMYTFASYLKDDPGSKPAG
jgi:hypothetical protein